MGYINHISRFVLLPGTAEAIRLLNIHGYLIIVVSNQSGVAQGYCPIELVDQVHTHMMSLLREEDAHIDGIFFCPHHPMGSLPAYSIDCDCRKPATGLIEKANKRFDTDMENSYVIGDRCSDIEMAHRAKLKGILVSTGYGLGDIQYVLPRTPYKPFLTTKDLLHAVRWILKGEGKS
jgi:D-glycero-D-manno-heptose 1,7-bisphosphate phosphatase